MENSIERGDIFWVFLDPAFGREIGGYKNRPVLVISARDAHRNTRIVTIVPGTKTARLTPRAVRVDPDPTNRLREVTFFQCDQIRAVDQGRMTERSSGRLARADLLRIETAIKISLALT